MKGYQLKITIRGSKPPIWRRVIVPEKITFGDLDDVIESIFGWTHSHMYEFYFPKENMRFSGDAYDMDDMDDMDANETSIDQWMQLGNKCIYTYDFGDNWEHEILVEKEVPYDQRYAVVVKSKGSYMIEDCGGIWGYYQSLDEAEEFDPEWANRELEKMKFEEAEPSEEDMETAMKDTFYRLMEEMGYDLKKNVQRALQQNGYFDDDRYKAEYTLEEVLNQYKKENLIDIAKIHGFRRYSGFKKRELAQWLANHLLETTYMKQMLDNAGEDEIYYLEGAIREKGLFISEELMSYSLLLCTYGAFSNDELLIPMDVQEKYHKICTPDYKKERDEKWFFINCCKSACYLYGVISLKKILEIYEGYGGKTLNEKDARSQLEKYAENQEGMLLLGEYIISEEQLEEDSYKDILKEQGKCPYYIPESREEFITYGQVGSQQPHEHGEKFIDFLRGSIGLDKAAAFSVFYDIQNLVRNSYPIEDLQEMLLVDITYFGKKLTGAKKVKEAKNQLMNLFNCTRIILLRGHSRIEMQQKIKGKTEGKVIAFPGNKKIYPNDPCPCGSGKKYKHCCGK